MWLHALSMTITLDDPQYVVSSSHPSPVYPPAWPAIELLFGHPSNCAPISNNSSSPIGVAATGVATGKGKGDGVGIVGQAECPDKLYCSLNPPR
ncbi:hypothetical protein Tco_1063541 [Tanacetum coccineum]